MGYFIRKYNRNRKFIWFLIGITIAIISLIHIINNEFKQAKIETSNNDGLKISEQFYDTNYSVISSQKLNVSTSDSVTDIIKQFINYCNEGNIESAYNMLSKDCKEVVYPTVEIFKTNYYDANFDERKTYNLQSWITYNNKFIYMVELANDMLSTGTVSNIKKQDYYTVVKEDNDYYLNISGFVEKNSINASKKIDTIEIIIESQEVFIEYVNLNIIVNNKTKNKILLDSGRKGDTAYITDSEDIKYVSYLFENNNSELIIPTRSSKNFKIRYMKNYKVDRPIKTVNFEAIVLNYEGNNSSILSMIIEL